MSKRPDGNMVMRSVYLPEELDSRLRAFAYLRNRSKGDLIREFVQVGLKRLEDEVRVASKAEPAIRDALERSLEEANIRGVDVEMVARVAAEAVLADLKPPVTETEVVPASSVVHAA